MVGGVIKPLVDNRQSTIKESDLGHSYTLWHGYVCLHAKRRDRALGQEVHVEAVGCGSR